MREKIHFQNKLWSFKNNFFSFTRICIRLNSTNIFFALKQAKNPKTLENGMMVLENAQKTRT